MISVGGSADYIFWNGARLTPWMNYVLTRLNTDFKKAFPGKAIVPTSGLRLPQEQIDIFLKRYVTAANIRGRKVYDTRVWNGVRYYRISDQGTVAVPKTSNHEVQGDDGAVDIVDTGSDAGITSKNSVRGRWIRDWCRRTGLLIAEGDNFAEGWHFKVPGIFRRPPSTPAGGGAKPITPEETKVVKHYVRDDAKARRTKLVGGKVVPLGMDLAPGGAYWLNESASSPNSHATNIVGGVGEYSFVEHIYAEGTPGDMLLVRLYWDNTKTTGPHSGHFEQYMEIPSNGLLRENVPFARAVAAGYAVYARLMALETNKGPIKVTRFYSDAVLFKTA